MIGGPWWRYLASGGAGAAVGAGIGYAGDRMRKNLEDENRQTYGLLNEVTAEAEGLNAENNKLKASLEDVRKKNERLNRIVNALGAANGAPVEGSIVPSPISRPGSAANDYY